MVSMSESERKESWVVVKFLMEATGLRTRPARQLLIDSIDETKYATLFMQARAWDQENKARAARLFQELLGNTDVRLLRDVARRAQLPSAGEHEAPAKTTKPRRVPAGKVAQKTPVTKAGRA